MLFGTKLLALVAALSTITVAAPAPDALPLPDALEKRNCPRYGSFAGAKAIAGLYLGNANNKSRQIERLIEEAIALLVGDHPKCQAKDIYVWCDEDKEHWGWKRDETFEERGLEERNGGYENCDQQYPYKHCSVSKCCPPLFCGSHFSILGFWFWFWFWFGLVLTRLGILQSASRTTIARLTKTAPAKAEAGMVVRKWWTQRVCVPRDIYVDGDVSEQKTGTYSGFHSSSNQNLARYARCLFVPQVPHAAETKPNQTIPEQSVREDEVQEEQAEGITKV
ncbi:MAG: hypothetical protein M1830_006084 [Pleopsidium flavum]|nr:MAG: hypothetical protein M1830_006084 [Pleopsidium flavum]